ncbi:MAG: iron-containing alcohol dehydrogenase, partial [Actinomycetota bacterium]
MDVTAPFTWRDGGRVVRFGRGAAAGAAALVDGPFTLLTTPRSQERVPDLASRAGRVLHVGPGPVDALADEIRTRTDARTLVAVGGGRVIDTAKAVAASMSPPARVVAIPTTLSGAEMTAIHRLPAALPPETPRVRPRVVVNDPELSASLPEPELVASALNALAHCAEATMTTRANPVATLAALEGARLIVTALAGAPDRDALALGALLGGYAIDSAGYGLHHVLSQTLVRYGGVPHGAANAVLLPHTLRALAQRFPDAVARLGRAIGEGPVVAATRLAERAGATTLAALGVDGGRLMDLAIRAAERSELALTPPAPDTQEIWAI